VARIWIVGLVNLLLGGLGTSAYAREPHLDVRAKKLRSALFCQESVTRAARTPVLLVTGTGVDGSEAWPDGLQISLRGDGVPSCYVNFPRHTTDDIQVSVEYVVYAIRQMRKRSGQDIAVYGISQGGLLVRFALTYWPSLRKQVSDVALLAGTHHGTTAFSSLADSCDVRCRFPAAAWQQAAGSEILKALNRRGRPETFGPTSWTTVRTLDDEVVQPTGGARPTSALRGASNLVIQSICPGRTTNHLGTSVDSVSYAALRDALSHKGPARAARINASVCQRPYAPGLDAQRTKAGIDELYRRASPRTLEGAEGGVLLAREPRVRAYVRAR
jgi:triacylglycerol lipase